MIYTAVVFRGIEIVPLAYTASSWGLLTVPSKVIMFIIMAAAVPEHIIATRTFWGIYCLNKSREKEARGLLPVAMAMATYPEVRGVSGQDDAS